MTGGPRYIFGIIMIVATLLLLYAVGVVSGVVNSGETADIWVGMFSCLGSTDVSVLANGCVIVVVPVFAVALLFLRRRESISAKACQRAWFAMGCLLLAAAIAIPLMQSKEDMDYVQRAGTVSYRLASQMGAFLPGAHVHGLVAVVGMLAVILGTERKVRVFLVSVGLFLVIAWSLLPLARLFLPDFYFDGSPYVTLLPFGIIFILGLVFDFMVIPVLWPEESKVRGVSPTIDDVRPSKGKTVRAIVSGDVDGARRRTFLFGRLDEETILKWGVLGQAMIDLFSSRVKKSILGGICLLLWPVLVFEVTGGDEGAFSRDVDRMWRTAPGPDGTVVASREAMLAARRVFGREDQLRGLTAEQVREKLKMDGMDPRYKLNRPLYGWEKDRFMLRIGNGRDSYVLHLAYGPSGKVAVVLGKKERYSFRK